MKKTAILIDGGYLRALARKKQKKYSSDLVEKIGLASKATDEEIYRILYYDCEEFSGSAKLPVSGNTRTFTPHSTLLDEIAAKPFFAVRKGVLKFRGFKPVNIPVASQSLSDADFKPDFEQKGVDMRIGLDIALFCQTRAVERIISITNDTDTIPAMKYGRRAGLQIVLIQVGTAKLAIELPAHADFIRPLLWP
jgi:uncharacterized LabA/DUF88 family protein